MIAEFCGTTLFDPCIDEIEADADLSSAFLYSYHAWYWHEDNTEEMMRGDLMRWLISLMDSKYTGEHNGQVESILHPKRKVTPKKYGPGDSMATRVMPDRWARLMRLSETAKRMKEEDKDSIADAWESRMREQVMGKTTA